MTAAKTALTFCLQLGLLTLSLATGVVVVAAPSPVSALDRCMVGQRVLSPAGRPATVVSLNGSACVIRVDGQSFTDTYAAFMLSAAPGASGSSAARPSPATPARPAPAPAPTPASGGGPAAGLYQCVSGSAGNLTLRILGGGRYANAQGVTGRYSFDAGSRRMRFSGGPWDGYGGRLLDGGRIGLSADVNASFYQMTCDRRGN